MYRRVIFVMLFSVVSFMLLLVTIPAVLVTWGSTPDLQMVSAEKTTGSNKSHVDKKSMPQVSVYLVEEKRVIRIPMDSYIVGVVAAEMPTRFHIEALKAQALTARTFIVNRLVKKDFSDMSRWPDAARGAVVSDSVYHQAYMTDEKMKRRWGSSYRENIGKITQAVKETGDYIITYKGKPIYPAFFSTSNGRTQNSEDYFLHPYPYLKSVSSPWDRQSPEYKKVSTWKVDEMVRRLERVKGKRIAFNTSRGTPLMQIQKRTSGLQVAKILIGDQTFSGRQVREALQLPSADFDIKIRNHQVSFETRGYGHGVGMSQWGADGMAKRGKSAKEIIHHYYHGVQIKKMPSL